MALEGALRDLGLAEVIQLLAGGRRTGALRVSGGAGARGAILRFAEGAITAGRWDDEPEPLLSALTQSGQVDADDRVAAANWASQQVPPRSLVDGLVETGATSGRTRDTVARRLIDDLCFELTTFAEGSFSFHDAEPVSALEPATTLHLSGEELFLDAARRRDEWPAIESRIGSLGAVPVVCDCDGDGELAVPADGWRVLSCVDACRTVRQVASAAGMRVFETARWVSRWTALGVLTTDAHADSGDSDDATVGVAQLIAQARRALADARYEMALAAARTAIGHLPRNAVAHVLAGRALLGLGRTDDWAEEVRLAVQLDPLLPEAQEQYGYVAARRGEYAAALSAWEHYLEAAPMAPDAAKVRIARDAAAQLQELISAHAGS
jgi:tetratricopeptide (TPR) repeat protein